MPRLFVPACRSARLVASQALLAAAVAACSDGGTAPAARPGFAPVASARWNAIARDLVAKYRTDPPLASRVYALVSVAQDSAVSLAAAFRGAGRRAVDHAAAVGASATVLTAAYPLEAAVLDSLARGDLADPLWSADTLVSVSLGDSIGRAAAQRLLAARAADGWDAPWTGSVPVGAGVWFSSASPAQPPLRPLWGSVRPWLLTRGDQLRPEPPPAFGSPAFQAALAEVRRFSDARTPRQLDIVKHWGDGAGTYTPPGHWNRTASELVTWYNLSEGDAAHVLALVNMAMMDAGIAVWDAKYAYWLVRPSQADPAITTPVGLPNFPSYVSGHAGFSGAAADVLGSLFPRERAQFAAQAEEAAVSRLYGGIHYRFDSDVGLRMGRAVAALAVAQERARGGRLFTTRAGAGAPAP